MQRLVVMFALLSSLAILGCGKKAASEAEESKEPATEAPKVEPKPTEVKTEPVAHVDHPLPGDPVAGEAVYKKVCLACHGANGRGNGGITGADFIGDKTRLAKSNEILFTSVSEGKLDGKVPMPPQKSVLSEQEINDSLAYIRQEFGSK